MFNGVEYGDNFEGKREEEISPSSDCATSEMQYGMGEGEKIRII